MTVVCGSLGGGPPHERFQYRRELPHGHHPERGVGRALDSEDGGLPAAALGGSADRRGRRHGCPPHRRRCRLALPEEANLVSPESVVAVHASYIAAGAELIETNTFGANRRKLATRGLDHELEAINSAGVRLAREAREVSGRDVMIAGSIGPVGELELLDRDAHAPLSPNRRGRWRGAASTSS